MNKPTEQAPCKTQCEAQAFYIEIRGLKARVAFLESSLRTLRRAYAPNRDLNRDITSILMGGGLRYD